MESFVNDFIINSSHDDDLSESLLERRLSPYATLRADDLAALLRVQSNLPPLVNSLFGRNHGGNDNNPIGTCRAQSSTDIRACIFKGKEDHVLCADENDGADDDEDLPETRITVDLVCRGAETNNSPAEYTVKGLRHHEMPVIGVCVDKRICVGFKYIVRRIGGDNFLFRKTPKTLLSIGMGYGKRLTFSGDSLNNNECYFWSDSEPTGYAFSLQAVDIGQKFSILDADNVIVGEVIVDSINGAQEEISSNVLNGAICKRVQVTLTCSMKYYQRHNHGLMEMMMNEDTETISGVALLIKNKKNRAANLIAIEKIFLPRFGLCKLEPDA